MPTPRSRVAIETVWCSSSAFWSVKSSHLLIQAASSAGNAAFSAASRAGSIAATLLSPAVPMEESSPNWYLGPMVGLMERERVERVERMEARQEAR